MNDNKKFTIIADGNSGGHPIGTICYEFHGHDYGCAREDTALFGVPYNSMTLNEDGSGPFFTCSIEALDPKPDPTYWAPERAMRAVGR